MHLHILYPPDFMFKVIYAANDTGSEIVILINAHMINDKILNKQFNRNLTEHNFHPVTTQMGST